MVVAVALAVVATIGLTGVAQAAGGQFQGVTSAGAQLFGAAPGPNGTVLATGGVGGVISLARFSASAPDPSFGSGGQVLGTAGTGRALALQADGKIVVAASGPGMLIERFNGNGTPDGSFGNGGVVNLFGTTGGAARAIGVGADGKIVVAGSALLASTSDGTSRLAVARLNPNGSLDYSFGAGGTEVIDFLTYSTANGLAVQPDGKVVLVGSQRPGFQITNGFIARLTTRGGLDPSFSGPSGGPALFCRTGVCFYYHPGGGAYASLNAVTVLSDGKIAAAGVDVRSANTAGQPSCTTYSCPQAIVVKLQPSGAPDAAFGAGGVAALPSALISSTGDPVGAYSIALGGKGDLIAAGDFQNQIGGDVGLWAFTPGGQPDSAFGSGGTVMTPLGSPAHGRALAVTPDGTLFVAGEAGSSGFIARYAGLGPPPAGGGGGGGGGGGSSGQAPTALTGKAVVTGLHTVRLGGSVAPGGVLTSYYFQYGPTAAYRSKSAVLSAGAGSTAAAHSLSLHGLAAGRTYHFRLVAVNALGTSTGVDSTFSTPRSFSASAPRFTGSQPINSLVSGLPLTLRCNDACSVHASLSVSSATARALKLRKGTTIASGFGSVRQAGTARLRLSLTRRSLKAPLSRFSHVASTLRIVVSSPARKRPLVVVEPLAFGH